MPYQTSWLLIAVLAANSILANAQADLAPRAPLSSAIMASQRALDAETAASIATSGSALYQLDERKREWGQYCGAALALADRGEFRLAVREASKALHLGQSQGNPKALAYAQRDLAYVHSLAGDLDRATMWAEAAIATARGLGTLAKFDVANELYSPIYKTLADIAARRGDYDAARKHYASARSEVSTFSRSKPLIVLAQGHLELTSGNLKAAQEIFENNRSGDYAPLALRGLAEIAVRTQRPAEAEKYFEEAAKAASKDSYQLMWARLGVAQLRASTDPKAARQDFDSAIVAAEQLRARFHSIEVRSGFFGNVQDIFDAAVAFGVRNGLAEWALEVSEKSRARATLDQMREAGGMAQVAKSSSDTLGAGLLKDVVPNGATMVVYHITRDTAFAWTVTKEKIAGRELAVSPVVMADKIAALRDAIVKFKRTQSLDISKTLYADLIKPLGLSPAEMLIVIPHRTLHLLPFAALHGGERYLIEDAAVTSHLSATAFADSIASGRLEPVRLLAFGNPDRNDPEQDLPGAEAEVLAISTAFNNRDVFVRGNATRSRFLQLAAKASVVHVATHATVDDLDPRYSKIHLATPLGTPGDVEAHEILKLDLKQVDLVTLSACNTGVGRVAAGEEFQGFKRSFAAAGARRLLVSLWPVADESTARTMEIFYAKRADSTSATALRAAQLDLLRTGATADPFFWAPFMLVGDYR